MEAYRKRQFGRGKQISNDFRKALKDPNQISEHGINLIKVAIEKILRTTKHYEYNMDVLKEVLKEVNLFDDIKKFAEIIRDYFLYGSQKSYSEPKVQDQRAILDIMFKKCQNQQCSQLKPTNLLPKKILSITAIDSLVKHQQNAHNCHSFIDQLFDDQQTLNIMSDGTWEPLCNYLLLDWNAGKQIITLI